MRYVLLVLVALGLLGCPAKICMPNETRCSADLSRAEFCSADGDEWMLLLDCANDIGEDGWQCQSTPHGDTCLPAEMEAP